MNLKSARHLVNGTWHAAGTTKDVIDPGNGSTVGEVAWGGAEDATIAADAAAEAFGSWSRTTVRHRADLLRNAADLLAERRDELAHTLALEAGKRLPEAQGEVDFSVEYFRWFAEEARRATGTVSPPELQGRRHLSSRRPIGVALSLTPWNFPVSIQARKLAAMLAAGCTVVGRVSEKAPLAATGLFEVLHDAGFPAGVVNLVHGPSREITGALMSHPAVRAVSFTGSTGVGRQIMVSASERVVRPLLELGGNAPFIVFEDADLDAAVEGAVLGRLRNTGQSCVAANRFLVQDSIAEEFARKLGARFDAMTVGHGVPDDGAPVPDLGPVIDAERVSAVQALVDDALERGARRVTERTSAPAEGSYLAPTLLTDVPDDALLVTEEVFGPAAGVVTFSSEDEAIRKANATEMGLAAYVWSGSPKRGWDIPEQLEAGIVGVNDPLPSVAFAPMGGAKQSGLGREGSSLGLEEFEEVQYVAWRP
ncbi:succinate-semialdehyde dehydrogenase/glutarate-semialdehyde dehydrogenase [Pseudarthrobacter defluvii]|uniref:NAD-dependent succinate-semialdehyde dehydrogenase n=1 Tax=Pseudarthrobacter defluvii TaxID=410837 RepID=UPI00278B5EBA|nr:NAD-dependent succinate-semialdehyde dehydrogenase [Pseudarthrobacter defluvii]MDQ0770386.1 succinate-semialdehyde dehydrogenase/glutarate-semialdehyde dehydrogenase [Pseudarthrobacter defluvii]